MHTSLLVNRKTRLCAVAWLTAVVELADCCGGALSQAVQCPGREAAVQAENPENAQLAVLLAILNTTVAQYGHRHHFQ